MDYSSVGRSFCEDFEFAKPKDGLLKSHVVPLRDLIFLKDTLSFQFLFLYEYTLMLSQGYLKNTWMQTVGGLTFEHGQVTSAARKTQT